jgi:hypothetical protein
MAEFQRGSVPDASARAGNDGHLTGQPHGSSVAVTVLAPAIAICLAVSVAKVRFVSHEPVSL